VAGVKLSAEFVVIVAGVLRGKFALVGGDETGDEFGIRGCVESWTLVLPPPEAV
jgi:hypothetical protein